MPTRNHRQLNRRSAYLRVWLSKRQFAVAFLTGIILSSGTWLLITTLTLRSAATRPVDAVLVLGGSITREIYAAELAQTNPETPILISAGSPAPCIQLIFDQLNAPTQQIWLENCARSTFENFYFSLPILQRWQARKVKVITSPTHTPRAIWLAKILLGAHGIWVEPDLVTELGKPANREFWWKTALDVTRSLGWAVLSQLYQPQCLRLQPLEAIAPPKAQSETQMDSQCERQGMIKIQNNR